MKIECGADYYYGLGRMLLRQHDQVYLYADTFTNASQQSKQIIGPIANGKQIAKCVMQQFEDLNNPDRDNISNVGITMTVRSPVSGICTVDTGTVHETRSDFEPEDKHMVAIIDSDVNIEGRCIQVHLDPTHISTAGSVTVTTYCDIDNDLDYLQ